MKSYHLTQEQIAQLIEAKGYHGESFKLVPKMTDIVNAALDQVLGEQWISVEDRFPGNERVITFSPAYEEGEHMRHRVMDGQFVKVCFDVTHWMPLPSAPKEQS